MFFLFFHQAKEEVSKLEKAMIPCKKCGTIIQGPVHCRIHSGLLLFIPYRFRIRFVRCPACGYRQKVRKEIGVFQ